MSDSKIKWFELKSVRYKLGFKLEMECPWKKSAGLMCLFGLLACGDMKCDDTRESMG